MKDEGVRTLLFLTLYLSSFILHPFLTGRLGFYLFILPGNARHRSASFRRVE
jgi:hypothetical protein